MDQKAYDRIMEAIAPFLQEKELTPRKDGDVEYFSNGQKAVQVIYDEQGKLFVLQQAVLEEGKPVKWERLSTWLYDEQSTERDAASIGADFEDTLRYAFGIRTSWEGEVSLPGKGAPGQDPGVEAFTNRFLAMFPQYKDAYKENVSRYGTFLYDRFYSLYGVQALRQLLETGTKKQCDRFFGLLDEMYCKGDRAVSTCIVYSLLAQACVEDPGLWEKAAPYLENRKFLADAGKSVAKYLHSSGRRKKYLLEKN